MKARQLGFTLLEILLVMVISSSLILLMINFTTQKTDQLRRDKTTLQMQQIMSAALSYYANNSDWPVACGNGSAATWQDPTTLSTDPSSSNTTNFNSRYIFGLSANPYGQPFSVACTTQTASTGGNFYVATSVNTRPSDALSIAGNLPMAFINKSAAITQTDTSCATSPYTDCETIVTSVSIPGQNMNNARSVNFAGLYYSGSCVPAPTCPAGMSPSIIVMPSGVTGVGTTASDANCSSVTNYSDTSSCSPSVYPINSFTAFARGADTSGNPGSPGTSGSSVGAPFKCDSNTQYSCVATDGTGVGPSYTYMTSAPDSNTTYWRVCLSVSTQLGAVTLTSTTNSGSTAARWRQLGKMMGQIAAFTRCVPNGGNERPSGSSGVFQPSS